MFFGLFLQPDYFTDTIEKTDIGHIVWKLIYDRA